MYKQIIFSTLLTVITISAQNMNAAECKHCMVLRNDLLASVLEQTRLTTQNLQLAQAGITLSNEYDKLEKQYDRLVNLNKLLINRLENISKIHTTQRDAFIDSVKEQKEVLRESIERSNKNVEQVINRKAMTSQCSPVAHLNEYKGFYFTDDRHKFIYQHAPSQNNSLTN